MLNLHPKISILPNLVAISLINVEIEFFPNVAATNTDHGFDQKVMWHFNGVSLSW